MYLSSLLLKNFRNYQREFIEFDSGINILTGLNAQGKTNSAEAIFLLCTGYSPRANKDKLFVKSGEENAEIEGIACGNYGNIKVKLLFNLQDKKRIFINDLETLKVGELLGNIHSVFFNPQELKLVQESPEDRRRFMNISLCQMSKSYFYALNKYNKILAQRNILLKDPDKDLIRDTLPIWDEQLSREGAKIIKDRNDFLNSLSPFAIEKQALLSDGKETLSMKTESGYYGSEEEIAYALKEDFKSSLEKDIKLGFTSIGPHRDDIKFLLNDMDVRSFGSQGQQRTVALSIKLAEAELFNVRFGEYPVLILDDVLSELDKTRQKKLVSQVSKMQTIFTTTFVDRTIFKGFNYKKITIENGKVKNQKTIINSGK